jgi:small subunit ribosomal protein S1
VRVTDFGAFVELEPGVEGLAHLSELSWSKKTRRPSDVVKTGEWVEVMVLAVNAGERRISLGLKQALGDPWEEAQKNYPPGAIVEAPVTSLTKFGAFVELADGIEGMIHIGDISREKRLKHPSEALSVGQRVRAQVLDLDKERRRLRLGMKQLEPTTADEYIADHHNGEIVTGRVVQVGDGRMRVELGDGVLAGCPMPAQPAAAADVATSRGSADLAALTAMLSAKWKTGGKASASNASEPLKAGQIRRFRITQLDAGEKRIELELTD